MKYKNEQNLDEKDEEKEERRKACRIKLQMRRKKERKKSGKANRNLLEKFGIRIEEYGSKAKL